MLKMTGGTQAWEGGGYGQVFMVRYREKYRPYKANSSEGCGQQPSKALKVYVCGVWIVWYGNRQVFQGGESRHPGNVSWKKRITEPRFKKLNSGLTGMKTFSLS